MRLEEKVLPPSSGWGDGPQVFPVDTRGWFISLSIYMAGSFTTLILFAVVVRFFRTGFSVQKTFEHLSPLELLGLIVSAVLVLMALAFLFSLYMKRATITVEDGVIKGLSYWGIRKEIPIHEITGFFEFSNNGVEAIRVESLAHGKVFISTKTERLSELFDLLSEYLSTEPEQE